MRHALRVHVVPSHLIRCLWLGSASPVSCTETAIVKGLWHQLKGLIPLCMVLSLLLVLIDKDLHPLDVITRAYLRRPLIHFRRLEVDCRLLCRRFILGLSLSRGGLSILSLLNEVEDVVLLNSASTLSKFFSLPYLR